MGETATGKKFLVIGATGNAGGLVTPALLARNEQVRCLVRTEEKAGPLFESGAEIVIGNLADRASLAEAFDGIDSVFSVIATGPDVEALGTNLVEAAVDAKVGQFVRYSLFQNSHIAKLRSGKMQAAVDELVRNSGLNYTIIQPHSYMQNLMAFTATIQSDSAFYLPYGDGKVGVMDLRDVAEVSVEVLTSEGHDGKSYTITGPESITMYRAAEALSDAIGKTVSYVDVPPEAAGDGLRSLGMDDWLVDEYLSFFDVFKHNHGNFVTEDFENVMGRPSRSIDDFARDFAGVFEPSLASSSAAR